MSKTKFFYDSIDDCIRRISGTMILFQGDPVWVDGIVGLNKDQVCQFRRLPLNKQPIIEAQPFTPKDFTIRNLPSLGYCDYKDYSYYLTRQPARQGKQGLCRTNVHVSPNPDGGTPSFENLLVEKSCVDMLKNRYRSFHEVFEEVRKSENPLKRAFSKTMSLHLDDMESLVIESRDIKVAICNNPKRQGPLFRLVNKYGYLKEEFEEQGIRIEA